MHYYKRNLGDYAKKAGRLSMLQHGSYTLLMDACYDREQFPTMEEAIEWTWASTTEEIEAVRFVLRKFFILENGVYVQKRIQEELAEYHLKAETNKRIAIERETKRKNKITDRAPVVNEPPPNHKPLTINQEPLTNTKETTTRAEALLSKKPASPKKPFDLPVGVDKGAWSDLDAYRTETNKKTWTDQAKAKTAALMGKFSAEQQHQMVDDTIRNGWRGVFPPKPAAAKFEPHHSKPSHKEFPR